MLERMEQPDFPQPVGIFRAVERPTYEDTMVDQIDMAISRRAVGNELPVDSNCHPDVNLTPNLLVR
jgi:hypothetical protein